MITKNNCPECGSNNYKKNGHTHNGKQNHQYNDCGREFVLNYLDEQSQMLEVVDGLIKKNLIRIAAGHIFEMWDGGVQDKALSTLMKDTVGLIALRHTIADPQRVNITQINQFNFQDNEEPYNEGDNKPLQVIREALRLLRG